MDTLRITDDTTTYNIKSVDGYRLRWGQWAPAVSRINRGMLGPFYENVAERWLLNIEGSSVSQTLQRNHQLRELLLQAERWYRGEPVDAVKVEYKPEGSALTNPVSAVIVPNIRYLMPGDFDVVDKNNFRINGVAADFGRRGLWLGDTETKASAKSTGNPAKLAPSAFTDDFSYPVPHDLEIAFGGAGVSAISSPELYLLVSNAADKLYLEEAESFGTKNNITTHADANASAGNVAQSDTGTSSFYMYDLSPSINSDVRHLELFAVLANNSSTVTWDLYYRLRSQQSVFPSRKIQIDASTTSPRVVRLGRVVVPGPIEQVQIYGDASASITAGNELEIDYICAVAVDGTSQSIHGFQGDIGWGLDLDDYEWHIFHRLDSKLEGESYITASGGTPLNEFVPIDGSPEVFVEGTNLHGLFFGHTPGDWVVRNAGGTEQDVTLTAVRTRGYLLPR